MKKKFRQIIKDKTGNGDINFIELYKLTGVNLIITGTDIGTMKTVYFHKDNPEYAKMPVYMAIRISTSVPFAYQHVPYAGKKWIDGAMFMNLPIGFWDKEIEGEAPEKNMDTIGFMVSHKYEKSRNFTYKNKNVFQFTTNFIDALVDKASQRFYLGEQKEDGTWLRSVEIDTEKISVLDFHLTEKQFELLFERGYSATAEFFGVKDSIDLVFDKWKHFRGEVDFEAYSKRRDKLADRKSVV